MQPIIIQVCNQQQTASGNKNLKMLFVPIVRPLTMKLGMLMYHHESSSKQKLQACKQQQTASGNKNLYMVFVPINCLWLIL